MDIYKEIEKLKKTVGKLLYRTNILNSTSSLSEPTSTADTIGKIGDIVTTDDYIFVKTNSGWKRTALSTF
jgi:hypothetical protein